jgi:hypothetical protein
MSDNATAEQTAPAPHPLSRAVIIAVLAASIMVGGFAISTQSYGIDEATSLIVAMAPNPGGAWKYAQAVGGSTIQMPLYHIYLYGWHKAFGDGEWAMRASNLPWFFLAQLAFLVLLRHKPKLALVAALLAAVSPTVWMYLDEARPYIMQYAAACWFIAAIARFSSPLQPPLATPHPSPLLAAPPTLPLILALGLAALVLLDSSLLGVVWTAGFVCALLWLYLTRPAETPNSTASSARHVSWALAALTLAAILLAAYYVWTWAAADRGYHRAGLSLVSLPYVAYEFLGFSGYGPGKLQLRSSIAGSLAQSLPALLPLAVIIAALGLFLVLQPGVRSIRQRTIVVWLLALALPALLILITLLLSSYRPLPRHFIPALPAVVLGLASLLNLALTQERLIWRVVALLLPALWLGSALNLRLREVHAKDDYRAAAAIAATALRDNKEVWWAADAAAAYIYLTPVAMEEIPGRAWAMQAPAWDDIRFKFPPRVIVISKPDIYDPQGSVARYAAENRFVPALELQAFTIFAREGENLPSVTP